MAQRAGAWVPSAGPALPVILGQVRVRPPIVSGAARSGQLSVESAATARLLRRFEVTNLGRPDKTPSARIRARGAAAGPPGTQPGPRKCQLATPRFEAMAAALGCRPGP